MHTRALKVKSFYDGVTKPRDHQILVFGAQGVQEVLPFAAQGELERRGIEVEDCSALHLVPGLIDAHVHLMLPGDGTPGEAVARFGAGEVQIIAARNAQDALKAGITTLRDCGGWPRVVFDLRRAIKRGLIEGPDLVLCGSPLTPTGGHIHYMQGEVDTPEEAVKKIRIQHKQGADFVKLIATGGGTHNVVQHSPMLGVPEMRAAAAEAHRLEKKVTAHACTTKTIWNALNSGVDMIEHLLFADEANRLAYDKQIIQEIAGRGIVVCHTLSVLPLTLERYRLSGCSTPQEQAEYEELSRLNDVLFEGFRRSCGEIPYIPGTDAGWRRSAFGTLVDAMKIMEQLGMSRLQVLHSATGLAAKAIGVEQFTGTLEPGKQADFLLLSGSPAEDLEYLRRPCRVYKKGKPVAGLAS